jgi:hypothetical protein
MGLCEDCPRPIVTGRNCLYHAYKRRETRRRQYAKRVALGLCPVCGGIRNPDMDDGYILCLNCRSRIYEPKFKEFPGETSIQNTTVKSRIDSAW